MRMIRRALRDSLDILENIFVHGGPILISTCYDWCATWIWFKTCTMRRYVFWHAHQRNIYIFIYIYISDIHEILYIKRQYTKDGPILISTLCGSYLLGMRRFYFATRIALIVSIWYSRIFEDKELCTPYLLLHPCACIFILCISHPCDIQEMGSWDINKYFIMRRLSALRHIT